MDLRFNYDHIRAQIDSADIDLNDPDGLLAKDIKRRMHQHVDCILEYEQRIREFKAIIKEQRMSLKKLAADWEA